MTLTNWLVGLVCKRVIAHNACFILIGSYWCNNSDQELKVQGGRKKKIWENLRWSEREMDITQTSKKQEVWDRPDIYFKNDMTWSHFYQILDLCLERGRRGHKLDLKCED